MWEEVQVRDEYLRDSEALPKDLHLLSASLTDKALKDVRPCVHLEHLDVGKALCYCFDTLVLSFHELFLQAGRDATQSQVRYEGDDKDDDS